MSNDNDGTQHPSVLLLQRGDENYGVASTVTEFAKALANLHVPLKIVCVSEGDLCEKLRVAGLAVHVLGLRPPPKVIAGNLLQRALLLRRSKTSQKHIARSIVDQFKDDSIEVVQTMNYLLLESCGLVSRNFQAVGVWRMPSGVQSPSLQRVKQIMMSRICDKYNLVSMANSEFTKQSIRRSSPLSVVVHHGCDATRFCPDTVISHERSEFGILDDGIVFGIFAHIHPNGEKGQSLAVEALVSYLNQSKENLEKVHLMLFGDPTETQFVKDMVALADTCQSLTLHVPGSVAAVENYYGIIDVSLSTRLSPEPFGLSVIESMMMGVPVLAHALGGPAETVIDGKTGWLVPDASVSTWIFAFERVMEDRPNWLEYSTRARLHALENFTIDAEVEAWSDTLAKISSHSQI